MVESHLTLTVLYVKSEARQRASGFCFAGGPSSAISQYVTRLRRVVDVSAEVDSEGAKLLASTPTDSAHVSKEK